MTALTFFGYSVLFKKDQKPITVMLIINSYLIAHFESLIWISDIFIFIFIFTLFYFILLST